MQHQQALRLTFIILGLLLFCSISAAPALTTQEIAQHRFSIYRAY